MPKSKPEPAKSKKRATPTKPGAPGANKEWRASGLCAAAQADGVPCAELGKKCEECVDADPKFLH